MAPIPIILTTSRFNFPPRITNLTPMNIATFGNFFGPDTLIIFLVILLLFGAKKLPELARGMGQAVREFSKAKDDIEREVTRAAEPSARPPALYEPKTDVSATDPDHHVDVNHHDDVTAAHHGDVSAPSAQPDLRHSELHVGSDVLPPKPPVADTVHRDSTHVA
jgi:sec-independent protein translocase protein TatA